MEQTPQQAPQTRVRDQELVAMERITRVLETLPESRRADVLLYLAKRYTPAAVAS